MLKAKLKTILKQVASLRNAKGNFFLNFNAKGKAKDNAKASLKNAKGNFIWNLSLRNQATEVRNFQIGGFSRYEATFM